MTFNAIEEIAEKVLIDTNNFKLVIDPIECAKALNIIINAVEVEDNVSGFISINGKTVHLGYNKNHHVNRQRFTIAHEIGHYILHASTEPLFIDKISNNEHLVFNRNTNSTSKEYTREKEADNFAAALLMPRKLIDEEIVIAKNKSNPQRLVVELSDKFKVSFQAMSIRLSHLGFFDYNNIKI